MPNKRRPLAAKKRKKATSWRKKPPTEEGWYWYRDKERDAVLHVFEPHAPDHGKAWDWDGGRLMLCSIQSYQGEWYGPLEVPE